MRSNCLQYALPRWLSRVRAGEETYLIFRISRVRWGFFHCLLGRYDPETDQIAVTSYKPPPEHVKSGFAPTFHGQVVSGDAPPHNDRQSNLDL